MKNDYSQVPQLVALGIALSIPACSDANVDLQKQITVLKDALEKAKAEKTALEATPREEGTTRPSYSDPEALKQNYEVAGRGLRSALEKQLKGVQVESFTLYNPKLELYPHRSEFSIELKSGEMKFNLDRIPVKCSIEGTWIFPSLEVIVAQIERVKALARVERAGASNSPVKQQPRSAPDPSQTGVRDLSSSIATNKTVSIEWDTHGSAPPTTAQKVGLQPRSVPESKQSRQEEPPATRQGSPNSVMPAQQEIQIKF
jgi:hypothetical protein